MAERSVLRRASAALVAALLAAGVAGSAAAQSLSAAAVPLEGPDAGWFVPPGWRVAHQARGDLNRDRREDVVLHLVPAGFAPGGDPAPAAPGTHGLVVLLAEPGGGLRRAGFTIALLPGGVPRYAAALSIRRGVLTVRQSFGDSAVTELTHRFRHDRAAGRFVMLRRDSFTGTRPPRGDFEMRSDDYVYGVRTVTTGRRAPSGQYRESTRREAIPRTRVLLEHVVEAGGG